MFSKTESKFATCCFLSFVLLLSCLPMSFGQDEKPLLTELPPPIKERPAHLKAEAIHWQPDLRTALIEAKKSNRRIFFYSTVNGCGPCAYLEANTFSEKRVIKTLNRDFICVQNNYSYNPEVYEWATLAYKLPRGWPSFAVIESDGKTAHIGYTRDPEGFLAFLYRSSIDWSYADRLAEKGKLDALKMFLEEVVTHKYFDSKYVILQTTIPDPIKQEQAICVWRHRGSLVKLNKSGLAYLKCESDGAAVIRFRRYRFVEFDPGPDRTKVEVVKLVFEPLKKEDECTLSGVVTLPSGVPAINATVYLNATASRNCDLQGKFSFSHVSPGLNRLNVILDNEPNSYRGDVETRLSDRENKEVFIELQRGAQR